MSTSPTAPPPLAPPRPEPRPPLRRPGSVLSALRVPFRLSVLPVLPVLAVVALLGLPVTPGSSATPADAASGLVVLCALVRVVRGARRPLTRTAAILFGLPVVGIAVAAAGALTTSDALAGLARYLQVFVLVPVGVLLLVRDRRGARLVLWSLVGLALWQGAIGVRQNLTATGALYQGADIRAVGTFGPSDVLGMATVVAFGVVAATGLALGTPARRLGAPPPEGWGRVVAAVCAVALLVPLALSFSRGAWIATAFACGAQLLLVGVRRAAKVFAAAAAVAVVLVGGIGVGEATLQERLTSVTQVTDAPDQSVVDRYTMWAAAGDMWRGHPITGVGLKAFPAHRDGHASLALSSGSDTAGAGQAFRRQPLLSPHNMYLLLLSEQGMLGLLTVAGSWFALLVIALRRLRRSGRAVRDCALPACGLLLWQLVNFLYADIGGPSTILAGICLGLAAWWALGRVAEVPDRATAPTAESGPR